MGFLFFALADAPRLPSAAHSFVLPSVSPGSQVQSLPSVSAQQHFPGTYRVSQTSRLLVCLEPMSGSLTVNFRPLKQYLQPVFTAKNRYFHIHFTFLLALWREIGRDFLVFQGENTNLHPFIGIVMPCL